MLRTRDFSPRVLAELGPGCTLGHVDIFDHPTSTIEVLVEGDDDVRALAELIETLDANGYGMSGPITSHGNRSHLTFSTPRGEEHMPAHLAACVPGIMIEE